MQNREWDDGGKEQKAEVSLDKWVTALVPNPINSEVIEEIID